MIPDTALITIYLYSTIVFSVIGSLAMAAAFLAIVNSEVKERKAEKRRLAESSRRK